MQNYRYQAAKIAERSDANSNVGTKVDDDKASESCRNDPRFAFLGGSQPSFADFNLFHHLDNAMTAQPHCLADPGSEGMHTDFSPLLDWFEKMRALPSLAEHLRNRPELVGIGTDPGLLDRKGMFVSQQQPHPGDTVAYRHSASDDEGERRSMWLTADGLLEVR